MAPPRMMSDGVSVWPLIEPPKILQPLVDASVSAVLGFSIQGSDFISSLGAQVSTDWEIRTAPDGGGSLSWASANDLIFKLLRVVPPLALSLGQTYYIRARYRSSLDTSEWSADVRITT